MKFRIPTTLASLLVGISLATSQAETITGSIKAYDQRGPLAGANIIVLENGIRTASDEQGRFSLQNISPGDWTLKVSYIGLGEETVFVHVDSGRNASVAVVIGEEVIELDPFVVTGAKSGQARAINAQRTSGHLMNAVSADALGQFPDENAAEALQRVSGVSIERDQGEGRYVIIRGIDPDLNNISLDGVSLASPEGDTRKVALDVIPTDLISQIEVSKTFLPDMDGDAIGGSVNLKTVSPFDKGEKIASLKAQLLYNDLVSDSSYMFAGTYGDTFGSEGNSGVIVSANYQKRSFGSDNIEVDGPWVMETAEDGSEAYFAPEIEFRQYDVERVRKSMALNFEHLLSENTRLYSKFAYNYFNDQEYRHRTEVKLERGDLLALTPTTASVVGANKTDRDLKNRFEEQEILVFSMGGETRVDDWRFKYKASFAHGEENEPDRMDVDFRNGEDTDFAYDFSNPYKPVVSVTGGNDVFNPANFELDEIVIENNLTEEDEYALKFDAKRFMDFGNNPGFVKFGFKYRSKEKKRDNNAEIYSNDDSDATLLGNIVSGSRYPYFTGGGDYLQIDPRAIRSLFSSDFGLLEFEADNSVVDSTVGDYKTREDVIALYAMGEVRSGDWTFSGGARFEDTDFSTRGFEHEIDENEDNIFNVKSTSKDYSDVLLSLNARYDISSKTILRTSVSNTIARPKFRDSSIQSERHRLDQEIVRGNPDLDPYESNNLDVSIEQYNDELGLFSVNLFYKNIASYIFYEERTETIDGVLYEVTEPRNGHGASILGLELGWLQDLGAYTDALKGFSVYSNLTLTDSESQTDLRVGEELPFLKQADKIANLALTYENERVLVRLASSYRSEYLDNIGGNSSEDEYVDSHFQLDAKFIYKIDERSSVFLEAINLNDEPFRAYYGSPSRMRQFEAYSFSAKLGYSWKL